MEQPEPRAVLWDMDGTMINSAEYHWLAWRDMMHTEGYPLTYEQFAETFGQRNDTILRGYFGPDISHDTINRMTEAKEAHYRDLVRHRGIALLPGVQRWLDHLHHAGWQQAIASAAPRRNIETILDVLGVGPYFNAIVAAEDVPHGKPDPHVFLKAATDVGVAPHLCVVIEDAPAGLEGARRAGMRCIGVQTTHQTLQADRVVSTLDELSDDTFEHLVQLVADKQAS